MTALKHVVIAVLCVWAVYFSVPFNDFVGDDFGLILNNPVIQQLGDFRSFFHETGSNLPPEVSDPSTSPGLNMASHRPLTLFSYALDHHFWKMSSFGFHLTNALLHTVNVILVLFVSRILLRDPRAALAAALLFALHPVNAESVNMVAWRADLLFSLFFLLSFWAYLVQRRKPGTQKAYVFLFLSQAFFLMSLFSSERGILLPLVLMVYEWTLAAPRAASLRSAARTAFGYVVVWALYGALWGYHLVSYAGTFGGTPTADGTIRYLLTICKNFWILVARMLFPMELHIAIIDTVDPLCALTDTMAWAGAAVLLLMVIATVHFIKLKKHSFAIFIFCWFLFAYAPNMPLIALKASRYLYLPSVAFCWLLAYLIFKWGGFDQARRPRIVKITAASLLFAIGIVYAILTIDRNRVYRSQSASSEEIVRYYPHHYRAHLLMAHSHRNTGQIYGALREADRAVSINPLDWASHMERGAALFGLARLDDAMAAFQVALSLYPRSDEVLCWIGAVHCSKKELDQAIVVYTRALELNPRSVNAYYNLGVVHVRRGDQAALRALLAMAKKELGREYDSNEKIVKLVDELNGGDKNEEHT